MYVLVYSSYIIIIMMYVFITGSSTLYQKDCFMLTVINTYLYTANNSVAL